MPLEDDEGNELIGVVVEVEVTWCTSISTIPLPGLTFISKA